MAHYRPTLEELEAAFAVARRGSFRAAAIDMDKSTTALSSIIARLEAGLETRLFNRTTRSVALTEAGKLFINRVGPVLQDMHSALDSVRSQNTAPSGVLRINTFAAAARQILAPVVLAFLQQHPRVSVDLVTEGRLVDIVAEGFDLGVRAAHLVPRDMIAVPIGPPQRKAVVATPAFLDKHGRPSTPADLLRYPCIRIRLPNGALYPWPFERDGEVLRIDVDGQLTLDESSLAKTAVQEGVALGLFMELDVLEEIETGQFERVLLDWTPPEGPLCLYYPNRRNPSATLRAFIDHARSLFGHEPPAAGPPPVRR